MAINTPNFRALARDSLARAKAELAANDQHRLRYAALELREAMEALTYDRALAFKDDIPPDEYKTWQPRKLMAMLVDIDPTIGMTSAVAVGRETEYGKRGPPENMKLLGTDHVFTLANLKAHYDAIGSYLHVPSLENVQLGKLPDQTKLRGRCDEVVDLVDKILASKVWNTDFKISATLNQCMNDDCKKPIRKRLPVGQDTVEAQCFECKAEYIIASEEGNRVRWTPKMTNAICSTPDCPEKTALWDREIKQGTNWRCRACGTRNVIALFVSKADE
jgi:hypothetical protein